MEKNKKRSPGKMIALVANLAVAALVLCAVVLVGARLIGLQVFCVLSGSMEPTYRVGDLIFVKKTAPQEIQVGDAITFVLNENLTVATHRVVRIDPAKQHFFTKGDNNSVEDAAPVHYNNLIGRPAFRVPYLGYVSEWVKTPSGKILCITAAVFVLAAVFLPDWLCKKKKPSQKT